MAKHGKNRVVRPVQPVQRKIEIQLPLRMTDVLEGARNAFFELCVDAGRAVLDVLMEEDREALCGPKGAHASERRAYRHGSTPSEITLGGRRVVMRRPRVRSLEGEELSLRTFEHVTSRDPLDAHTLSAIGGGVSGRDYAQTLEVLPHGERERSVSQSSVSRRFVALTQQQMSAWLTTPIGDRHVRIVMIDGKVFRDHTVLIALGITEKGEKIVLGVREGTTENATVARALLRDLLERGVASDQPMLFVVDGGTGIRKAIRECFGSLAWIQRCQVHKLRNVLEHLPEHKRASVQRSMGQAWSAKSFELGLKLLQRLAQSLEREHFGAAQSLREGMAETLTLHKLGLNNDTLARTLRTTNPIENLMGSTERYTRNVKRWRHGSMILRWVSAAVRHAQQSFRRIRGHREIPALLRALAKTHSSMDTAKAAA
jgi:putative transposase